MALISSPGIGSGLDIKSLVAQLVAAESTQKTQRLDLQETRIQAKISALGALKSSLSDLQGSLSNLLTFSDFQKRSATSSETDILKVSASATAIESSYTVNVNTIAESHKLSASGNYTNTTSSITGNNGGTLTFQFGSFDGAAFTVNPDRATKSVVIDAANSSLQDIRDAINDAEIGVRANIIFDGSYHHLALVSEQTGADNSIKLTVTDDDGNDLDNTGLSVLAYDPEGTAGNGKNLTQTNAALSASLDIDGLAITSSSNTITNAIEGVTLELLSAAPATDVSVTVSQDTAAITSAVNGFIASYNKLMESVNSLSSYNTDTGEAGVLLGDSTLRGVTGQIRGIIASAVSGLTGKYTALSEIGITTKSNGTLELNSTKLSDALADDPDAVARIFSGAAYINDNFIQSNNISDQAAIGNYLLNISQLATNGNISGAAITAFPPDITIDAGDTFVIKVDDKTSSTITLTPGTYSSASTMAAEIQSRINGDSTLSDAGISVTVSYDTDHFVITSDRYGSASKVEFTTVDADVTSKLGFSVGLGTDGVDVAGTIGGIDATGDGQTLTGTGAAIGIELDITGGATGDRGTISVTRGTADRINTLLGSLLEPDGVFSSRTEILNDQIGDIEDDRIALQLRIEQLEARLLRKFNAMDALVAQLQATGDSLISQLSALPTIGGQTNRN